MPAKTYRLTHDEYLLHLVKANDPYPHDSIRNAHANPGRWVPAAVDGDVVLYDAGDGFYYLRTTDLLIDL